MKTITRTTITLAFLITLTACSSESDSSTPDAPIYDRGQGSVDGDMTDKEDNDGSQVAPPRGDGTPDGDMTDKEDNDGSQVTPPRGDGTPDGDMTDKEDNDGSIVMPSWLLEIESRWGLPAEEMVKLCGTKEWANQQDEGHPLACKWNKDHDRLYFSHVYKHPHHMPSTGTFQTGFHVDGNYEAVGFNRYFDRTITPEIFSHMTHTMTDIREMQVDGTSSQHTLASKRYSGDSSEDTILDWSLGYAVWTYLSSDITGENLTRLELDFLANDAHSPYTHISIHYEKPFLDSTAPMRITASAYDRTMFKATNEILNMLGI